MDVEKYTVCTMRVENFKLVNDKGSNSPLNRTESEDIDASR